MKLAFWAGFAATSIEYAILRTFVTNANRFSIMFALQVSAQGLPAQLYT
ncbi:hypothetical protein ACV1DR_17050 [Aeromonas jandaei]